MILRGCRHKDWIDSTGSSKLDRREPDAARCTPDEERLRFIDIPGFSRQWEFQEIVQRIACRHNHYAQTCSMVLRKILRNREYHILRTDQVLLMRAILRRPANTGGCVSCNDVSRMEFGPWGCLNNPATEIVSENGRVNSE